MNEKEPINGECMLCFDGANETKEHACCKCECDIVLEDCLEDGLCEECRDEVGIAEARQDV